MGGSRTNPPTDVRAWERRPQPHYPKHPPSPTYPWSPAPSRPVRQGAHSVHGLHELEPKDGNAQRRSPKAHVHHFPTLPPRQKTGRPYPQIKADVSLFDGES